MAIGLFLITVTASVCQHQFFWRSMTTGLLARAALTQPRTVPFWNETSVERRQDESNDGGFVGDYYWNSDNEGPYDAFHSTSDGTSYFAANAAGYMVNSQQAVSACTGFTDAQGALDDGIITYSWPGSPYQWYDGEMASVFNGCAGELGDGPQ